MASGRSPATCSTRPLDPCRARAWVWRTRPVLPFFTASQGAQPENREPIHVTEHSLPPRRLRRADHALEHESCRHRTTRTARGSEAPGTARAEAEAGLGADPGPRLRAQPLRAVHSARPLARGQLPAYSRDRGGGGDRGRSGHRVVAGPDRRHSYGRYGPTVRRFLRRVHLRSGQAGANTRHDA